MPQTLSSLPPPPQGQTGVTLSSLKSLPSAPTGQQGMTLAQVQAQPQATLQKDPFNPFPVTSHPTSAGDAIWQALVNYTSGVKQAAQGGADQINQAATTIQKGGTPIQGLEAGLQGESGIASVISSPIAPLFSPVGKIINDVTQPIQNNPSVQKFAESQAGQTTARVAGDIASAGNVAQTILGVDQATKVAATIPDKITNAVSKVKDAMTPTPEEMSQAVEQKTAQVDAQTAKQVQKLTTQWTKPTTVSTASFNKARAVLSESPDTPQFLAQQGLDPRALVENGKYATEDTAQSLRDTAGKLSSETLRPSLQMADYQTPKTPVSDITSATIEDIKTSQGVTPDDMETQIAKAEAKGEALQRKYPDGMSLSQMHDEKITYASNGRYSPVGDTNVNNISATNRAFGRTLASMVEKKAPPTIPVADFNSYLSEYYKAADYLDSLNTKTAPVSLGQALARSAAKYTGAALGEHLTGGVVSAFAGYSIGKAIEHALENLSAQSRATFIRNLQITNPEAFTQVQAYLDKVSTGNTGVPLLKAADSSSPIPLGPDTVTPKPSIAPYAAKTKLPVANPKTGRMQTVYTSAPK